MKYIILAVHIIILISAVSHGQTDEYKTHLFLGTWVMRTEKDITTEKWELSDKGELKGISIYEYDKGSFLSETMHITDINGKLNFCATVLEQNPENPQGEICFGLKSYKDRIFLFENPNHDFPKRITYDFSGYNSLTAHIEGDTNSFELKYERYYDPTESFTLKGKIIKEQFVNKAGRIIQDIYDYFYVIQGEKYFIKLSDCSVNKETITENIGKEISSTIVFHNGLWDADDNTYQSRVGKYITILNIND
jgi:hypothetical protein